MGILNWLIDYWDSVVIVIVAIIALIILIKRGEIGMIKQVLFNLITKAENAYGAGTGELKYAAVADWIYQRIPSLLKIFFTSKDIDRLIESALKSAKETWMLSPDAYACIITDCDEECVPCDSCEDEPDDSCEDEPDDPDTIVIPEEDPDAEKSDGYDEDTPVG